MSFMKAKRSIVIENAERLSCVRNYIRTPSHSDAEAATMLRRFKTNMRLLGDWTRQCRADGYTDAEICVSLRREIAKLKRVGRYAIAGAGGCGRRSTKRQPVFRQFSK